MRAAKSPFSRYIGKDHIIAKNPGKDRRVNNPAKPSQGTWTLTPEQLADIRAHIQDIDEPAGRLLVALLAYTSMRREEALGLMWENVDFDADVLKIRNTVVFVSGKTVIQNRTKTDFSARDFPIAPALREILLQHKRDTGYVVSVDDGVSPLPPGHFRRMWGRVGRQINLYGANPRNFRTSFASVACAASVDIRTTQALMGHSTPEMTLKVYAKQIDSQLPNAISKLDNFLKT